MSTPAMHAQPQVQDLKPYQPGMPIETLARHYNLDPSTISKLASNENPLGMSPAARTAIQQATDEGFRYPDQYALRQALATRYDVPHEMILLSNGSNDVLDLVARVFLGPDTNAVLSQYSFIVYGLATRMAGAASIVVPAVDYGHDLQAMGAAINDQTRVIWIANPNNPTGTFVPYDDIARFMDRVPSDVIVVLDEAYHEYLQPNNRADTVAWLQRYPNLIITRTFSKMYGLAGLRVGYALATPEIANLLNRVRQPFNVNGLGLVAAIAALDDTAFVEQSYQHNLASLQRLREGLDALGLTYLPAYGNFITVAFDDAVSTYQALLQHGVIVRPLNEYGLPDHLRISIGTTAENERLLASLRQLMNA